VSFRTLSFAVFRLILVLSELRASSLLVDQLKPKAEASRRCTRRAFFDICPAVVEMGIGGEVVAAAEFSATRAERHITSLFTRDFSVSLPTQVLSLS
jgi:hypothetical protein